MEGTTATQCKVCEGTGLAIHSSSQDVVVVPLPREKEEQLSLDNPLSKGILETFIFEIKKFNEEEPE